MEHAYTVGCIITYTHVYSNVLYSLVGSLYMYIDRWSVLAKE